MVRSNMLADAIDKAAELSATQRTDESTRTKDTWYLYGMAEMIFLWSGVEAFGVTREQAADRILDRVEYLAQTKYNAPYNIRAVSAP